MNNHREDASPVIYLRDWANDIDANSGGHSVDAAKLRSIAEYIEALTEQVNARQRERDAALDALENLMASDGARGTYHASKAFDAKVVAEQLLHKGR